MKSDDEIIEWAVMWDKLFYIFLVFFFFTIVFGKLEAAALVICAQILFIIFNLICRRKHKKLHERYEAQDGE